jgi:hypothetical protein
MPKRVVAQMEVGLERCTYCSSIKFYKHINRHWMRCTAYLERDGSTCIHTQNDVSINHGPPTTIVGTSGLAVSGQKDMSEETDGFSLRDDQEDNEELLCPGVATANLTMEQIAETRKLQRKEVAFLYRHTGVEAREQYRFVQRGGRIFKRVDEEEVHGEDESDVRNHDESISDSAVQIQGPGYCWEEIIETADSVAATVIEDTTTVDSNGIMSGQVAFVKPFDESAQPHLQNHLLSSARLIGVCQDSNTTLAFYDSFMKVLIEEMMYRNFNPLDPALKGRKAVVHQLSSVFGIPKAIKIRIPLEVVRDIESDVITVSRHSPFFIKYNFEEQLRHLLKDDYIFGDPDNLVIKKEQPFGKHISEEGVYDEILDGDFWNQTCPTGGNESHVLYLSAQFYTDETGTDRMERHPLAPLVFTLTCIAKHTRFRSSSWKHLGFLPDAYHRSKATRRRMRAKKKGIGQVERDYHACLREILSSFVDYQKNPKNMWVRMGGDELRYMKVVVIAANILGDAKSNDMQTGRTSTKKNTMRLCRACHVPSELASNVMHPCVWVHQFEIEKLTRAALGPEYTGLKMKRWSTASPWLAYLSHLHDANGITLTEGRKYVRTLHKRMSVATSVLSKVMGSHVVDNAWFDVDFGPFARGVFGATPTDLMHAFEEGIIPYILEVIIGYLSDSKKEELDQLVISMMGPLRLAERKNMPRINLKGGFTKLTHMTCNEKVGCLFLLGIVMHTKRGSEILESRFDLDFDTKREETARRFRNALEAKKKGVGKRTKEVGGENANEKEENGMDQGSVDSDTGNSSDGCVISDSSIGENQEELQEDHEELTEKDKRDYVKDVLGLLSLNWLLPMVERLGESHVSKTYETVWDELGRFYGKQSTCFVQLPTADRWVDCLNFEKPLRSFVPTTIKEMMEKESSSCQSLGSFSTDNNSIGMTGQSMDEGSIGSKSTSSSSNSSSIVDHARKDNSIQVDFDSTKKLVNIILGFHAHYKYGYDNEKVDLKLVNKSTRQMIGKITKYIKRAQNTTGWNLQKIHDILHVCKDVELYGSPMNNDAGTGERGLKDWAKWGAVTASKRNHDDFLNQVADRNHQRETISTAVKRMSPTPIGSKKTKEMDERETVKRSVNCRLKHVRCTLTEGEIMVVGERLHSTVGQWFQDNELNDERIDGRNEVKVYTEVVLEDGTLIRASQDYRKEGDWYEWVLVKYESGVENDIHYVPGKCLGFFGDESNEVKVLLHSCNFQSEKEAEAGDNIFSYWSMACKKKQGNSMGLVVPKYMVVGVDCIEKPIYVVEEYPGMWEEMDKKETNEKLRVIYVHQRNTAWKNAFI